MYAESIARSDGKCCNVMMIGRMRKLRTGRRHSHVVRSDAADESRVALLHIVTHGNDIFVPQTSRTTTGFTKRSVNVCINHELATIVENTHSVANSCTYYCSKVFSADLLYFYRPVVFSN